MERPTSEPEFDENGNRIVYTPRIDVPTAMGELALTYFNTTIRLFEDETYNHIEFVCEDGQKLGLGVSEDFIDTLQEHDYPQYFLPFVDESSQRWYEHNQTRNLDAEIDEFFG